MGHVFVWALLGFSKLEAEYYWDMEGLHGFKKLNSTRAYDKNAFLLDLYKTEI